MSPRPRSAARRRLGRTLKILLFLFVFIYFGIPAITNARDAIGRLTTVQPFLLLVGLGLEVSAFMAYGQLTRAALPDRGQVGLLTVNRIQFTTRAVTNVVPGGSAAGAAIGYRMLTLAGVRGTDAGFALVAAAMGSGVMLNVLLWVTLIISIPLTGFHVIYLSLALVGVMTLGLFFALVMALARGEHHAERLVRAVAAKVRILDGEKLAQVVQRLGERVRDIMAEPALVRRLAQWASLDWLLDAAALWVFMAAFGATVRFDLLIVAFCVANMSAFFQVTPGGLGVLDATLVAMLALFGYPEAAGLAVPMYRLAQYWLPIPLGVISYVTLRRGPWRIDRQRALRGLRTETEEAVETGETIYEWADRYGARPAPPRVETPPDVEP